MTEHPYATELRRRLERFEAGDPDWYDGFYSERLQWHTPGEGALAGDLDGRNAVLEAGRRRQELFTGWTVTGKVNGVVADDRYAVALVRVTATRDDETRVFDDCMVFTMEDGLVVAATDMGVLP